jgi:hypothetical protein
LFGAASAAGYVNHWFAATLKHLKRGKESVLRIARDLQTAVHELSIRKSQILKGSA